MIKYREPTEADIGKIVTVGNYKNNGKIVGTNARLHDVYCMWGKIYYYLAKSTDDRELNIKPILWLYAEIEVEEKEPEFKSKYFCPDFLRLKLEYELLGKDSWPKIILELEKIIWDLENEK
jgi:hypothetical protein